MSADQKGHAVGAAGEDIGMGQISSFPARCMWWRQILWWTTNFANYGSVGPIRRVFSASMPTARPEGLAADCSSDHGRRECAA